MITASEKFIDIPVSLRNYEPGRGYTVSTGVTEPIYQSELRRVVISGPIFNVDSLNNYIFFVLDPLGAADQYLATIPFKSYTISSMVAELQSAMRAVSGNNNIALVYFDDTSKVQVRMDGAVVPSNRIEIIITPHHSSPTSPLLSSTIGHDPELGNISAWAANPWLSERVAGLYLGQDILYLEAEPFCNRSQYQEPTERGVIATIPFSFSESTNVWSMEPGLSYVYTYDRGASVPSQCYFRFIRKNVAYGLRGDLAFGHGSSALLSFRVSILLHYILIEDWLTVPHPSL